MTDEKKREPTPSPEGVLRRMLSTPPQPRVQKAKPKPAKQPKK